MTCSTLIINGQSFLEAQSLEATIASNITYIPQSGQSLAYNLQAKAVDFILNYQWNFPAQLLDMFPNIKDISNNSVIPIEPKEDKLLWNHTTTGVLSLQDAYSFISKSYQHHLWSKFIWNPAIPPSNSTLMWRIIHRKMPTDENLAIRVKQPIDLTSAITTLNISKKGWNPQCALIITAAVMVVFKAIWYCRNQIRFKGKQVSQNAIISSIIASVALTGNSTKLATGSSIYEFTILKAFSVQTNHPKAPQIIEVIWCPPFGQWLKCNTDGSALGSPGLSACAGIYRNNIGDCVGCFASHLGTQNSFFVELMAIILAI
ncbi:uncharacterized protein LOC131618104 [Vicia villosa]|uniref:uncharacterized protein LOC131618104 n=1 Tax=Vicia villosa TaxID=3911 RepID=UPI00273C311E|nr:uncharacterized protein LOC131618104 [Vicia villosa]